MRPLYISTALLENILAIFIKSHKWFLPSDTVIPALGIYSKEHSHLKKNIAHIDVHSFSEYLLILCQVLGTVLGARGSAMNKTDKNLCVLGTYTIGETDNKQNK